MNSHVIKPHVFATRPDLVAPPPWKPRPKAKTGSYCFKAVCDVFAGAGDVTGDPATVNACPIAKITGYDTSIKIGDDTEYMCRQHVRNLPGGPFRCGDARVVILPSVDHHSECSGQFFFTMGNQTKRLV